MSIARFKEAQERFGEYETALEEVRQGRKRSHWIWYIFPQLKGLGRSYNSEYYGIASLEEAKEYLGDAVLRGRLLEISEGAVSIVRRCLDGEERIQDEQSHQLDEGELAVRILNRTHRFGLYDELAHLFVYRIDRLTGVIMSEKVFEFRNYLSIFVHG